jgi:predicted nucleic-acid-binding Zn-ribbon protein
VGFFSSRAQPVRAWVQDNPLACLVCGADEFLEREVKLNTSGMEFLDLAWANQSALGLVCTGCGYLHEFVGDTVRVQAT